MNYLKYTLTALLIAAPASFADEVYATIGLNHLSAIQTGPPSNSNEEMAYDAPFIGIEYHKTNWDMVFESRLIHIIQDEEMHGSNPRISFEIKKRFRIFQK